MQNNVIITKRKSKNNILISLIGGTIVGFINGFFGGGGGMLVVPILIHCHKLEDKIAHATALLVILPISICSAVTFLVKNDVEVLKLLNVGAGFIIGGIIGAFLLKKANNKVIRIIFSVVMIVAGIKMLMG